MKYVFRFLLLVCLSLSAQAGEIYVLLSGPDAHYTQISNTLKNSLAYLNNPLYIEQISTFNPTKLKHDDLLITIGNKAASHIRQAQLNNPVIYGLTTPEVLPNKKEGQWVAPVLSQPVNRVSQVIDDLLIKHYKKRILVAVSDSNQVVLSQLSTLPQLNNGVFDIVQIKTTEKPAKYIEDKLFNAGALIAVHDDHIWQGENARWMLYQAYRYKVPVVGYSKNFLKAGALVSIYSDIQQVTDTICQQAILYSVSGKFGDNRLIYSNYNIEYNKNIARALGIDVPEDRLNIEVSQ